MGIGSLMGILSSPEALTRSARSATISRPERYDALNKFREQQKELKAAEEKKNPPKKDPKAFMESDEFQRMQIAEFQRRLSIYSGLSGAATDPAAQSVIEGAFGAIEADIQSFVKKIVPDSGNAQAAKQIQQRFTLRSVQAFDQDRLMSMSRGSIINSRA